MIIVAGLFFYFLVSLVAIFSSTQKSPLHSVLSAKRQARVENVLCFQFQEQQQYAGARSQSRPKCSQQHHCAVLFSRASPRNERRGMCRSQARQQLSAGFATMDSSNSAAAPPERILSSSWTPLAPRTVVSDLHFASCRLNVPLLWAKKTNPVNNLFCGTTITPGSLP